MIVRWLNWQGLFILQSDHSVQSGAWDGFIEAGLFIGIFVVVYLLGRFTVIPLANYVVTEYAPSAAQASSIATRVFLFVLALTAGLTGAGRISADIMLTLLGVLLIAILLGGVVVFESMLGRRQTSGR